jgi:hypothetical protein
MLPPIAQTNAELGPQVYREAMARLSAAVNVVTTAGPAGRSGFTATAVCSISDEPPFLLVCLNRASKTAPIVGENKVLCVNVLCAHESELADVFAGRTGVHLEDRFSTGDWGVLKTGLQRSYRASILRLLRVGDQNGRIPPGELRRGQGGAIGRNRSGSGLSRSDLQDRVIAPPDFISLHLQVDYASVLKSRI